MFFHPFYYPYVPNCFSTELGLIFSLMLDSISLFICDTFSEPILSSTQPCTIAGVSSDQGIKFDRSDVSK
jgi:hypothetical protein